MAENIQEIHRFELGDESTLIDERGSIIRVFVGPNAVEITKDVIAMRIKWGPDGKGRLLFDSEK